MRKGDYLFVLPALKTSGGNLEIFRLARELRESGEQVTMLALWDTPHPVPDEGFPTHVLARGVSGKLRAAISIAVIIVAFWSVRRRLIMPETRVVLTHYATFTLMSLIPASNRWFFVQDLEWNFVARFPLRPVLKKVILTALRSGKVVAANRFLCASLRRIGVAVEGTADIWADPAFAADGAAVRDVDVTMIFRKGAHKRADWGVALLKALRADRPSLRVVVISPDEAFASVVAPPTTFLLRPTREVMRQTYQRSRIFVLFSDHEGFGLPPLEAMGSGCVPLCRDAGGVRAYMEPELNANILPLTAPVEALTRRLYALLDDEAEWRRLSETSRRVFDQGLECAATRLQRLSGSGFMGGAVAPCE